MISLKVRSNQEELLDQENINAADLHQNLKELDIINRMLGGHKATFVALNKIIGSSTNKVWRIIDIGCGGGDTLVAIYHWAKKRNINVELTGVDLLEDAIVYAKKESEGLGINYLASDFNDLKSGDFDIALSSLVCHHLYDKDLDNLLLTKMRMAKYGLINDLHRHWFAYFGIWILTALFSKSYLVKNDARLSVARGFKKRELLPIFKKLNFKAEIRWIWAFRWMVILEK